MITSFTISSGATVSKNYSWDQGIPLTGTNIVPVSANTVGTFITGYAPGLKVNFKNTSVTDSGFNYITFDWDFGDYYNSATNSVSLSCNNNVEHTYLMPGIYTVTLRHRQGKDILSLNLETDAGYCIDKYDIRWFWNNTLELSTTWDQTACSGRFAKWWDNELACFAKYCNFWNWYDLGKDVYQGSNPITWQQTNTTGELPKKWSYEVNDTSCKIGKDATFLNTVEIIEQTYTVTNTVQVYEISPEANLYSITQPVTGTVPFTVQLTPRGTKPGSFAIEKIVWDFGDGSPARTVWRHQSPDSTLFTFTCAFSADLQDPRNYDAIYTYKRALNTYPVFYPSITAYSSCTNTADGCSTIIGPLALPTASTNIHILKSNYDAKTKMYALQVGKNTSFVTTQTADSTLPFTPTIPSNTIKPPNNSTAAYEGNAGTGYPPVYNPTC